MAGRSGQKSVRAQSTVIHSMQNAHASLLQQTGMSAQARMQERIHVKTTQAIFCTCAAPSGLRRGTAGMVPRDFCTPAGVACIRTVRAAMAVVLPNVPVATILTTQNAGWAMPGETSGLPRLISIQTPFGHLRAVTACPAQRQNTQQQQVLWHC